MKNLFFAILLVTALLISCGSTPEAEPVAVVVEDKPIILETISNFSGVIGKDWKLIEIWVNGIKSSFDRKNLVNEGTGEIFTFVFNDEQISGVGSPNRYTAPYTLGENNEITIGMVRATLMAAIHEPQRIREHDYFGYIQNTTVWDIDGDNLTLTSSNTSGARVFMVFSRL